MRQARGAQDRRGRQVTVAVASAVGLTAILSPGALVRLLQPPGDGLPAPVSASAATPDAPPATDPADDSPVAPPDAAPPSRTPPGAAPGPTLTELRGAWRVTAGIEEAAALATVLARRHLERDDDEQRPGPTGDARPVQVVDVAVEAIERPADDLAVVTVLAVVLDPVGATDDAALVPTGAHRRGRLVRLAVPLRVDAEGARSAGAPWTLPAPTLRDDPPAGRPLEDPAARAAARAALDAAGLGGAELVRLERTGSWPVLAHLTTSDGATTRSIVVWLRWHLDRFVVAGMPLDRATARSPDPTREG
jgi:hypothetical protein